MIELRIKFDGDFPGLAEKRLSVSTFGKPLDQLLVAARRIATAIIIEAVDESERGAGGGRIHKRAELLDLQIEQIEDGSLKLPIVFAMATLAGTQVPLFDELPERTGRLLVEAIREESAGHQRNARVRKYLESVPAGVTSQGYALFRDGEQLDEVNVGHVTFAETPADVPYVIEATGHVIGVGFEPGKNEVRVKPQSGAPISCSATAEQVESAITLRASGPIEIRAVVMSAKTTRLIAIRRAAEPAHRLAESEVHALVFGKWKDLLTRLA